MTGDVAERRAGSDTRLRVVVIDGRDLYRESLTLALESHDAELRVTAAASLDQALPRLVDGGEVDVVLVSVEGDAGDCRGCLGSLGRMRDLPEIPVLVLCDRDRCPHTGETIEHGVMGLVTPRASIGLLAGALRVVGTGGACFPVAAVLDGHGEAEGRPPLPSPLPKLSPKQRKVFALLCEGKTNRQIALTLDLAEGTVKVHVSEILKRLKVSSRTQAVLMASNPMVSDSDEIDIV